MNPKSQLTFVLGLALVLPLCFASTAAADETIATFAESIDVTVNSGEVVYRVGQTLVVDVEDGTHEGLQKFVLDSDTKVYRNGEESSPFELQEGDELVHTRITNRTVPVLITMKELEMMPVETEVTIPDIEVTAEVETEPIPEPEPVSWEPEPTMLPNTASSLPAICIAGLALSVLGLTILSRRFIA